MQCFIVRGLLPRTQLAVPELKARTWDSLGTEWLGGAGVGDADVAGKAQRHALRDSGGSSGGHHIRERSRGTNLSKARQGVPHGGAGAEPASKTAPVGQPWLSGQKRHEPPPEKWCGQPSLLLSGLQSEAAGREEKQSGSGAHRRRNSDAAARTAKL